MLAFGVFTFLIISGALNLEPGTNQISSMKSNTASRTSDVNTNIQYNVTRNEMVHLGSDVNLTCSDTTWSKIIYIVWNIVLTDRRCMIGFSSDGLSHNTCNSDKSLRNTSSGVYYLFIPNFSYADEGIYKCEFVYAAGSTYVNFNLSLTVSPRVSSWLEWQDNRMVAICTAAGGKPAASVKWRNMGNLSTVPTVKTLYHTDGSYTITSNLDLPEGVVIENLTCAVDHFSWETEHTVRPVTRATSVPRVLLIISVSIVIIVLGALFFMRKKLTTIRSCQFSSKHSKASKSQTTEDVEEVEPYACYVQRVNTIYN